MRADARMMKNSANPWIRAVSWKKAPVSSAATINEAFRAMMAPVDSPTLFAFVSIRVRMSKKLEVVLEAEAGQHLLELDAHGGLVGRGEFADAARFPDLEDGGGDAGGELVASPFAERAVVPAVEPVAHGGVAERERREHRPAEHHGSARVFGGLGGQALGLGLDVVPKVDGEGGAFEVGARVRRRIVREADDGVQGVADRDVAEGLHLGAVPD